MDTRELLIQAYAFYQKEQYQESFDFLMANKAFIAKDSMLYNYLFSLASKLNRAEDALFYFKEAIVTYDMWYLTKNLDQDSDLDSIRDLPEYKRIYNICKQKEIECRYAGVKKIDLDLPENNRTKLFFMLHGNSQYVERVKRFFNPTTIKDYIIALPQSREFQSFQNYVWKDIDFGLKVAVEHFNEVVSKFDIKEKNIVLSSYSAGAQVILKGLIDDSLTAKKAIFFGPWIPQLEEFEKDLSLLHDRNVKIYIVCGSEDRSCLPIANHFDRLLTTHKIDHKLEIIEGLPHTFPNDLKEVLDRAFAYFN